MSRMRRHGKEIILASFECWLYSSCDHFVVGLLIYHRIHNILVRTLISRTLCTVPTRIALLEMMKEKKNQLPLYPFSRGMLRPWW
mmetsp:Transcript_6472/g.18537  ORF Transcript_6472/g.18537 Transcript_6472/m.18537 type:complete len:85 (+) Transcript_6472:74-328(+)